MTHSATTTLALLITLSGCGAPAPEAVPYRFRHPLLGGSAAAGAPTAAPSTGVRAAPATAAAAAPVRWRRDVARRCRAAIGRTFDGDRIRSRLQLLQACLRRSVPPQLLRDGPDEIRRGGARPGDLVLFHNTRDANRNRALDDGWTDVGVVVRTRGARIEFVFLRGARAQLGVLDLRRPHRRRSRGGRLTNTFMRIKRRDDPPRTPYLAGQLLAGFASLPPSGAL